MQMTNKERCDALIKLAELKSDIREKRREIEFKVSIGLWALTAGAVAYLKGRPLWWSLTFLVVIVLIHSLLWVRTHFNSSERDAQELYFYAGHALEIVLPGSNARKPGSMLPMPKFKIWDFLKHEPCWFQVGVTPVLGIIVILASR
jgi:hypothetical protein